MLAEFDGTVNVQENAPLLEVVCEVHVWVPGVAPLKVNVPIFVLTEYPVPDTETVIPVGPWDGVRLIDGIVAVKDFEIMKLAPKVPCETATYEFPEEGEAIFTPVGIAPAAVEVKVVPVPLEQAADELELKQKAYRVPGA